MKFQTIPTSLALLALSASGFCQTSISSTSLYYCITARDTKSISPVPTTATTVTASTTKTTTLTSKSTVITVALGIPKKATATAYITITKTVTAPTQTKTSTITVTAVEPTVTAQSTIATTITACTNAVPKEKWAPRPVDYHPHGAPAIGRRDGGFPKSVNCFHEIYIQTFITTTKYSTTGVTAISSTVTSTATVTNTFTTTASPVTAVTTTCTNTPAPTTITAIVTSPVTLTSCFSSTSSSSTTSSAPRVCTTTPLITDDASCTSTVATTCPEDNTGEGCQNVEFTQFYVGTGFTENSCNPSTDGPGGNCYYWSNDITFPGTLCACDAIQSCVNFALNFGYFSVDLHYFRSSQTWQCVIFRYDSQYSAGSTAADFNEVNPDVAVAYGFQAPGH